MKERVKLALRKLGKVVLGVTCTIIGMTMAGFGIGQLFDIDIPKPKKKRKKKEDAK